MKDIAEKIPSKLFIDEVVAKGEAYPLILNFQHGYVNDSFTETSCVLLRDSKNDRKTVAMEVDGQIYAGAEEQGQLGRTFLMARHQLTGEVRIIKVGNVNMKPIISTEKNSTLDRTTDLELSRKFGSKKSKKKMEQKEKLKVNVDTVKKQMQDVIANASVDQIDLKDYIGTNEENEDFYVPPINRNAERVNQVYTLERIMPDEKYIAIENEIEGKDMKHHLSETMKELSNSRNFSGREKVLALYYSGMVKMYQSPVKYFSLHKFTFFEESPTLHKLLIENFSLTVKNRITRPPAYKDKLLGHALVIAMLLNDYKVNLDKFAVELKASAVTLMTKSKVTGATLERVNGARWLKLKLPLASRAVFKRGRKSR